MIAKEQIAEDLAAVRSLSPLVHNITNYVAMNNSANALLAIGASPVMAHAVDEMVEMVGIASALVVNIGTLDNQWIEGMITAATAAHHRGIPVVLDPVGAGATSYRTRTSWRIIEECHPTIIRGNGSEIMALVNAEITSKGVDSSASSNDALESARALARQTGAVVVISGPTDYVTDGVRVETVSNGSTMMTSVTGLGCTASALTGAFAAVQPDRIRACVSTMAAMGICGERAAKYSKGNGSLQINFLDELCNLDSSIITSVFRQ